MKRQMIICEPETEYAKRLMEFINTRRSAAFRASAFDSFEPASDLIKRSGADVLLISEKYADAPEDEWNVKKTIILTEDEIPEIRGYPCVCKYHAGERILREVESAFDAETKAVPYRRTGAGKIFCIYSPVGGCGKTSFALTLGLELAKEKRVLYLNLECCPALDTVLAMENDRNLSDLIYCARQGQDLIAKRLSEMTVDLRNLDCVLPVTSFEDISCTKSEEWAGLLEEIAAEGGYDIILIEPADAAAGFIGVLELSDRVYVPYKGDPVSLAKIESFERMLADCGASGVAERLMRVRVPYFNIPGLGRNYYESLQWSELGDCVRNLIGKENMP